ncbi:MAG: hypothetical protein AB7G93_09480 [Bdellovibrionales bacterium]
MKETKEALIAAVTLYVFIKDRLKDGAQIEDALALGEALMKDGKFKEILMAGYRDADKIDDEVKNFTFANGIELLEVLPELVEILQPKAA